MSCSPAFDRSLGTPTHYYPLCAVRFISLPSMPRPISLSLRMISHHHIAPHRPASLHITQSTSESHICIPRTYTRTLQTRTVSPRTTFTSSPLCPTKYLFRATWRTVLYILICLIHYSSLSLFLRYRAIIRASFGYAGIGSVLLSDNHCLYNSSVLVVRESCLCSR